MLFQKDYILRMIEMMGDVMRRISEMIDDIQRMRLLEELCREHCGLTLAAAEGLSLESLCDMLDPAPRFALSELIYIKAQRVPGDPEAHEDALLKSLRLLLSLRDNGPLCEARAERALALEDELLPALDASDLLALAEFFSEAERYADMEDALFRALERADDACGCYRRGLALLENARRAKPEALAFARMTERELEQSVRDWALAAQAKGVHTQGGGFA